MHCEDVAVSEADSLARHFEALLRRLTRGTGAMRAIFISGTKGHLSLGSPCQL